MRQATIFSVSVASILILIKLYAWFATDSLSLLTSLIDSLLDLAASLFTFASVRYALQPPDKEHRFGHGKAEDIAALAQSAFIAGSAIFIAVEAAQRFITPQPIENASMGIGIMIISIGLTILLVSFQRYTIKHSNSNAIHADLLHYMTDLLTNVAVIIAIIISHYTGWHLADPLFAAAISVYIFYSAGKIAYGAFQNLMDRELDENDRQTIINSILAHPDVKGVHALKTRRSGITPYIQFHLELDGSMTLYAAHKIADSVITSVKTAFPNADVIVHEDPCSIHEAHRNEDRHLKDEEHNTN